MNTILYFPPINKLGNVAFRHLCNLAGADFIFTEMIRIEKLLENDEFQIKKLQIPNTAKNKTIVQIICEDINLIQKGVDKVVELFPEVFEINYNMGCPQSSLAKKECGGGIVGNPNKVELTAKKLHLACQKYNIKASIKIRLGLNRENITIYTNIEKIKNVGVTKIYIHGRVLNDSYNRPATYFEIGEVKKQNPELEIIANGDVKDLKSLNKILNQTKADGVLIGRAALENPYIFQDLKKDISKNNLSGVLFKEKKNMIIKFLELANLYEISLSHAKANINYMTKTMILGNEFRAGINNSLNYEELIQFCKMYK